MKAKAGGRYMKEIRDIRRDKETIMGEANVKLMRADKK